jgi:hypothetical protein
MLKTMSPFPTVLPASGNHLSTCGDVLLIVKRHFSPTINNVREEGVIFHLRFQRVAWLHCCGAYVVKQSGPWKRKAAHVIAARRGGWGEGGRGRDWKAGRKTRREREGKREDGGGKDGLGTIHTL